MKPNLEFRKEHQFRDDFPNTHFEKDYFIGLDWIEENKSALIVTPKIDNLNYLQMFLSCFNCDEKDVRNKFKDIYHIDFLRKPIEIPQSPFELTPLLIIHFLKLTEALAKKGLKRDYILEEKNLHSKIKGRIVFSQHLKKNLAKGRQDRIYCRYQYYSVDCVENRIIKKTLLFVNSYLAKNAQISCKADLSKIAISCLAVFGQVTDDISIQKIKQFKINPLYHEYVQALKVAKLILKRFSYAIENANEKIDNFLPPFWIDMALLFEVYVLSLLKKTYSKKIDYHIVTHGNEIDFCKIDEQLIIDTKYIPAWKDTINHDNVRQLSGYARNKKIREKVMKKTYDETTILPCLIIYPNQESVERFDTKNLVNQSTKVHEYIHFNKFGIKLPIN